MSDTAEKRAWAARVLGVPLLVPAPQEDATPLLPIWTGAKEEIDGQLNGMLAHLRASTNPLGPKIAELGVSGLLKGLGVALPVRLRECDAARGPARAKAVGQLRAQMTTLRQDLASHRTLAILERNSYGAAVTIRDIIEDSLDRIERKIGATGGAEGAT
jgi:hypothetical protein